MNNHRKNPRITKEKAPKQGLAEYGYFLDLKVGLAANMSNSPNSLVYIFFIQSFVKFIEIDTSQ